MKRAQLLKIKAHVLSIRANQLRGVCLMIVCVCVLSELTRLPLLGGERK